MDYVINISVKNLNETKYLAKVFSLKFTTSPKRVRMGSRRLRERPRDPPGDPQGHLPGTILDDFSIKFLRYLSLLCFIRASFFFGCYHGFSVNDLIHFVIALFH